MTAETLTIWEINRRRAVMKIPVTSLCMQAGVGRQTYYDAVNGVYSVQLSTLARLNTALQRFKLSYGGDPGPLSVHAAYKTCLIIAAGELKANARAAMRSDPSRKATGDPAWAEGARVRRLAFWIANAMCGFRVSDIARAAGITKQAVSRAIKELEDDEDAETARICKRLEEIFTG